MEEGDLCVHRSNAEGCREDSAKTGEDLIVLLWREDTLYVEKMHEMS